MNYLITLDSKSELEQWYIYATNMEEFKENTAAIIFIIIIGYFNKTALFIEDTFPLSYLNICLY
jgi:hypothetical protein